MKIGFTYDLRDEYVAQGFDEEAAAEFDRPETIDAIRAAIESFGHSVEPIGNLAALMPRLLAGERWDLVFNIAENVYGLAREAQVPALLDAYRIPYTFSDATTLALCLHKGLAKHVVRDCGIATPDFVLVETPADLVHIGLPLPLFAKPVAEGTSKGISAASKITDHATLGTTCRDLLARYAQPVLVETFLPGREFTVGIVGSGNEARPLGVLEVLATSAGDTEVYSFLNKEAFESRCEYRLVRGPDANSAGQVALDAWRALGCRDGGRVDVRLAANGTPHFIEVNPLAGLNPERSDLAFIARFQGLEYRDLIGMILESALQRLPMGIVPALQAATS
ncbi:MAG TPA: D-alanine--D-alanine ligase [Gammaproteobacteria bacterium]|nr:D-alanine--D-alanine ligase [Gammaproteobacteria bacterium]